MAQIQIVCPVKNEPVATGFAADAASFSSMTLTDNTFSPCPACGGSHTWSKEDAFLEAE